ncbi:WD40/YVTN/BNR-like repeat-containing protein [Mucilaginibacter boryungensis]|uniref:Oxidoreductase n=1 Tax=Mucilaginibacter boryungensis TaxID=768480 RepID=A0ABR9XC16_9SPHI|nr:YCF48-related protein [Mucilaginibacter boryungensis]MBE9664919.1 oxidoreductase [Mucilaginibacter boryungensis]
MRIICNVILPVVLLFCTSSIKAQTITLLQQGKPTSIRGLSVVDDKTAWISGSKGYIAQTTDGGKTWNWQQVKGYEQFDFRDIEAFSAKEAIIMSSGTPAVILKTTDGGTTWELKYSNSDKAYFLDAMDFANKKHGFILGDPINNKFLVLETTDGGNSWRPLTTQPDAMPGEAAFAASGTCLRVYKGQISIVTGGKVARWLSSPTNNTKWTSAYLPVKHGEGSQGAFSIDETGKVVTGGDYSHDKVTDSTACLFDITTAGYLNSIRLSNTFPAGYQSCVEHIHDDVYLSTGTPGSNISTDGGRNWQPIDNVSYNVCRKAKKGNLILLAGDKGKIAIFTPAKN